MEVKIIEANGWAKVVPINRAITRIGSSALNDVQIPSAQIAPNQLQILYSPDLPSSCRLINLSGDLLLYRNEMENAVSVFQTLDIFDGDEIVFDDYRLVFHLPLTSASVQKTGSIEAALVFPEAVLRPDSTLTGNLKVKNAGNQQGVQFQVKLEGLPVDCYQVDPIPLMYPGAEEEVQVRLFHRTLSPSAGMQELLVTVSAPADYQGEVLIIRQGLYVAPVLKHELIIHDSYAAAGPLPDHVADQAVPLTPSYAVAGALSSISPTDPGSGFISPTGKIRQEDSSSPTAAAEASHDASRAPSTPTPNPSVSPVEPDQRKVKVVRTQGADYWDE
jgi:hypothetical protein